MTVDIMCINGNDVFLSNIQAFHLDSRDIRHTSYSKCLKHYKHEHDTLNDFSDRIEGKEGKALDSVLRLIVTPFVFVLCIKIENPKKDNGCFTYII